MGDDINSTAIPSTQQQHQQQQQQQQQQYRIYSKSILVLSPVPDLSMPYNVISIVSSFYCFIIGYCLNTLVSKSTLKMKKDFLGEGDKSDDGDGGTKKENGKMARIKTRLQNIIKSFKEGNKK